MVYNFAKFYFELLNFSDKMEHSLMLPNIFFTALTLPLDTYVAHTMYQSFFVTRITT